MLIKIKNYRDSLIYILIGIFIIILLNVEFVGILNILIVEFIGFLISIYFIITLAVNISRIIRKTQSINYSSVITFIVTVFIVVLVTFIHRNERFKNKRIITSYSLFPFPFYNEFILRENNDFNMNSYDVMMGNRYKAGKYYLKNDTIVLMNEGLKYYNEKGGDFYFNKYLIDSTKMLIIPIDKENHVIIDSVYMFGIK